MSYSKNQSKKATLFCKVCFNKGDAKLSRTHNMCDDKGNNCCPTLAAFTCTYCDANGHTQKFCAKKKRDQEREVRQDLYLKATVQKYKESLAKEAASQNRNEKENKNGKRKAASKTSSSGSTGASTRSFAALMDESDDDDDDNDDGEQNLEEVTVQVQQKQKQKQEISTARAAILGLWEPPKTRCWADAEEDEYHDYIDARKRYGFEAVDKADREQSSYKDAAKK